jgi:hypothetical protein
MPTSTYVPSLPNQGSLEQDIICQDNEHRKPKKKRNHNSIMEVQAQENHPPISQCTYKFQFRDIR